MVHLPEMNLFEAIVGRRSCRQFTNQPVEWEKICEIISAGMQAPSSGNIQNWSFIVITEKEKLKELFHHTLEQEAFMTAQIGIIICGDEEYAERYYGLRGKRLYTVQNCAACIQNMLLVAHALDLGAVWVGAFDEEKVDMMFSIPGHIRAQAIILLGYPDQEPEPKEKKEMEFLIHFNKYGEKVAKPHLILRDYSKEWELLLNRMKLAADQAKEKMPKREQVQERAKDAFKETKKKLKSAIESLKDEEKAKRRR